MTGIHKMKTDLSPARRKLLEIMQLKNYGSIENLPVQNGEPVFDPPPRVIREVKFGGENRPRPEAAKADFSLKAEVIELFNQLDAVRDGVIIRLEIQRGLPFRMSFEEKCA